VTYTTHVQLPDSTCAPDQVKPVFAPANFASDADAGFSQNTGEIGRRMTVQR
jgi:hypothetical protein